MINRIVDMSLRKAAIIAGFTLIVMTIFAAFAYMNIFPSLIVPGDAVTTANNIMANEGLFRIGIVSYVIVIICDVVVAWAFYVLFKAVHQSLSLLAAWFRLVYSIIFGITLANYFIVLLLLSGADYLRVFETGQLHVHVMLFLNAFDYGWDIGYVFFGLHLFFLGYLVFKSSHILFKSVYIPRILGVLLIIACFGYLIDTFSKFLFPSCDVNVGLFTGWGEALLMIWLLVKGWKVPEIES